MVVEPASCLRALIAFFFFFFFFFGGGGCVVLVNHRGVVGTPLPVHSFSFRQCNSEMKERIILFAVPSENKSELTWTRRQSR